MKEACVESLIAGAFDIVFWWIFGFGSLRRLGKAFQIIDQV
jgi:hypothetical protein